MVTEGRNTHLERKSAKRLSESPHYAGQFSGVCPNDISFGRKLVRIGLRPPLSLLLVAGTFRRAACVRPKFWSGGGLNP